ncbi:MAG: DUF2226 domain-containing protein, partial [Theionarchaea archaeon]|nr:DUF2226 domain-containing protein [Theionarchaea archaeon]
MKVPYGSKLAWYRLPDVSLADIVKRAVQEKVTGYIRVTTEKEDLVDFYIFLSRGNVVGGYSESGKEQVFGDASYNSAFYPFDKGLVDLRSLEESVVSLLMGNYPEMTVSTSAIPDIPEKESIPEDTRYLVIANMKIPQGDLLDFRLAVHVTDFWELLDDLEQRALTGYFRVFAEED